ncbi:DUF7507 domain-containing protein, partial [Ulvibacter antarcticus]
GTDQFVYEVCDDGVPQACDQATVYISIDPNGGGNEILAIDDINDTFVNLAVSGDVGTNDLNPDGPAGTEVFTLVTGPTNGTLTLNADGTYTYTPNLDYVGEDQFVYQICDAGNPIACDTATVTIEIIGDPVIGNDPPIANNDTNVTEVGVPIDGNILSNDFDPDGDPITVTANTQPTNGTVVIDPITGAYTYTPNPGYSGEDTFEYTICDDGTPQLCDTATVYIQIIPDLSNITVANDDAYYGEVNTDITGNLLENDSDPEGQSQTLDVTISPISGPTSGSVVLQPNGDFIYTPGLDFTGTDQFVYEIFDAGSPVATDQATVYIVINQTPAPAIAIIKEGTFNDEDGDGCADVDETITYNFTVVNTGNVTLNNVNVTDPLVGLVLVGGPIILAAGDTDTTTFVGTYPITQVDIDNGNVTNQATAEGTDDAGTIVNDLSDDNSLTEDDPTITVLCQNASIAVIKEGTFNDEDGDGCADIDETITYNFTVVNTGNVTLTNVNITDPLVGLVLVGGPITLAAGDTDTATFVGTYPITQVDIDNGNVTNQATAEGTDPNAVVVSDLSDDNSLTEDDPTVTELCQNASIAIIKEGTFNDEDGDGCADVDETITYNFTVVNTGNVTLTNVNITDPLPGMVLVGGPITLAAGSTDTATFVGTYPITQINIDEGNVTNQATVFGTDPSAIVVSDLSDDNSLTEDDPTVTVLCQNASIALIKMGELPPNPIKGTGCPTPGDIIQYTFTVVNTGNVTLTNVNITDPLPGIVLVGGPISLDAGETDTTTFTASYAVTQADIDAGQVVNQATGHGTPLTGGEVTDLSDDDVLTEDDPTVVVLCQAPFIALVKEGTFNDTNGDGCANVNETITYTFTVYNQGNVTLENITISDPGVNVVGGPITLAPLTTDATSFTAIYPITQIDIDAGFKENQAIVSGFTLLGQQVLDLSDDNSPFEDDPTITVLCQGAAIAVIKTATPTDENGDGCIDVNETIVYNFVVKNVGNVELTNIYITDPLVAVTGGPIILAAGDSDASSFMAIYTVTQADIDAGNVTNQATVFGTPPVGTEVSDLSDDNSFFEDDPTVVIACSGVMMSVTKSGVIDLGADNLPQIGELISYIFTVTNTGSVTLHNVILEDPLPGLVIVGGPIPVLLPGETDTTTFTATYPITQADIDAGLVINQARGTGFDINGNVIAMDDSDDPNDNTNFDNNGDGEPDDPTITIIPNVLVGQFEIFNGITPDGDGLNDYFEIRGIEAFGPNNVQIFNRWGVLVFETDNYGGSNGEENVFRGISEGRVTILENNELPTGTYYYVLRFSGDNPGKESYAGYLYINR